MKHFCVQVYNNNLKVVFGERKIIKRKNLTCRVNRRGRAGAQDLLPPTPLLPKENLKGVKKPKITLQKEGNGLPFRK